MTCVTWQGLLVTCCCFLRQGRTVDLCDLAGTYRDLLLFPPAGTYRDLLISESSAAVSAGPLTSVRGRRGAGRLVRSLSTWSVGSEEGQQLAVPGVGVLFAGPPSPAVAFVSRRGGAAGRAAVSNPYSPLRRLENGDGAAPSPPPPPPPPPPPRPLTNGHCPPPPPPPAGTGKERRERPTGPRGERRRVRKKLNLP